MRGDFEAGKMQALASAVAEEIESASWGHGAWEAVCRRLSDAFPGSCAIIYNEDVTDEIVHHFTAVNIDQVQIDAYAQYFAFRNPWNDVWKHRPSGYCTVSEREYPTRLLLKTEFYNDFVMRIDNFDAATGLNYDLDASQSLRFPLHYAVANAPVYDAPAEFVMRQLVGPLHRSVNALSALQSKAEVRMAASALIDRTETVSIVVDALMGLRDANDEAVKALSQGDFLRVRQGRVSFVNPVLTKKVGACVRDLASRPESPVSKLSHGDESGHWLISFSRLPILRINALMAGRQQILIQFRNMRPLRQALPDLREFCRLFRLTPAEGRLCVQLASGASLSEAAVALGITIETARQRIKSIFRKTGAHRQSELIAMLRQV